MFYNFNLPVNIKHLSRNINILSTDFSLNLKIQNNNTILKGIILIFFKKIIEILFFYYKFNN